MELDCNDYIPTTVSNMVSNDSNSFQLKHLLYLYLLAGKRVMYCDYFRGLRLLVAWVGPVEIPADTGEKIPTFFKTYELQELSVILKVSQEIIYQVIKDIHIPEK